MILDVPDFMYNFNLNLCRNIYFSFLVGLELTESYYTVKEMCTKCPHRRSDFLSLLARIELRDLN